MRPFERAASRHMHQDNASERERGEGRHTSNKHIDTQHTQKRECLRAYRVK